VCAIMSVLCLRMCQVCAVRFFAAMMWLLCVIAVVRNIRTKSIAKVAMGRKLVIRLYWM
jgi:hypothetical protein